MVGLWIKPFALTMAIMTAVSLFISFTLTPLLCSILLKPKRPDARSPLALMERGWNWMFDRVVRGYGAVLRFNERHRPVAVLVLVGVALLFIHSLSLVSDLGFSMGSDPDRGEVFVKLEFPTRYDLNQTLARIKVVEERLRDMADLQHMLTSIGKVEGVMGKSSEGVYLAQVLLRFPERDQRAITIYELMDEVRVRMAGFPDCTVTVGMPSFIGGQSSDLELEIAGEALGVLDTLALKGQQLCEKLGGFLDTDTTVRAGKPELRVYPRRAVLADLGLPATGLGLALRANLEGITAGTYKQGARNYDIVVKMTEEPGKDQVGEFLLPGAPGHPLLLTGLGSVQEARAPVQITRKDKRRISKVFSNLEPDKALGTAADELSAAMKQPGVLPPGYSFRFGAMYEIMTEGQEGLAEAGIIAIILVVLALAAILESFKQPVIILVTLPLALIGVFWALALAGHALSLFVLMGVVMLIGIVVNNAILIMDQFNVHVREGVPRHEAMVSAACERFRPIVMITLAAVLGMLPLAFGRGIGAELRNDVGIASVGGIFVSGVLTLIVMPILYDLFTRSKAKPATVPAAPGNAPQASSHDSKNNASADDE